MSKLNTRASFMRVSAPMRFSFRQGPRPFASIVALQVQLGSTCLARLSRARDAGPRARRWLRDSWRDLWFMVSQRKLGHPGPHRQHASPVRPLLVQTFELHA